jgi:two-component system, sensor histidine kinase and response regulator
VTEQRRPILDEAVLGALRDSVGGDDAFVSDLVETYLSDGRDQLAAIEAAVGAGDAAALVRPAHTLKSASLTVGAIRLGELGRTLEQRGRGEELDGAAAIVAEAREEWEQVNESLRAWLGEHGTPRP